MLIARSLLSEFKSVNGPITFSKLSLFVTTSLSAIIKFALAPAREDSDWATSETVISPLSSLILSVYTCLSNRFTFSKFILYFSFAKTNPVYASTALKKISCSFFLNFAFARSIPMIFF